MQSNKKPVSVDEYIALQPSSVRPGLEKLRRAIKKAAPEAEEIISYGMPGYKLHGMLVYFAAAKNHYGLYALPKAINLFKDRLAPYELSKGTIRFPFNKPVPSKLVTDIVKYRVKENFKKAQLKELAKNKKVKK